jgi:tetratricopeptide (TPR) repeat protein
MGTDLIMRYNRQDLRVRNLTNRETDLYRELVVCVARLALVAGEFGYRKALHEIGQLEQIRHRTAEECFLLGEAYRMVYSSLTSDLTLARIFLEESIRKDPTLAKAHFSLAWVHHEVGEYELAVGENEKAMSLDPKLSYPANRNAACALLKLGKPVDALARLSQIPAGKWWKQTYEDEDLQSLKIEPYAEQFRRMYEERRT